MSNWQRGRPDQEPPSRFQMKTGNQLATDEKKRQSQVQKNTQLMTLDNFNQLGLRVMSAEKVLENFKVNTWNDKFLYQTVNANDLQSAFLDNNPKFQELKGMLSEYNLEIRDAENQSKQVRNGAWRSVFFVQMLKLMREIMFTTKRELQAQYVDKIYNWAQDQISKMDYLGKIPDKPLRPETGKTRPFSSQRPYSGATSKQLRPTSGYPFTNAGETMAETTLNMSFDTRPDTGKLQTIFEDGAVYGGKMKDIYSSLSQGKELSRMQPSEIIMEQMKDYNAQFRTQHDSFEPPKQRLQNYKRRIIPSIDANRQTTKPPISEKKRTFPKPQSGKTQTLPFYDQNLPNIPSFAIPGMSKSIEPIPIDLAIIQQIETIVEGEQIVQVIDEIKKLEIDDPFKVMVQEPKKVTSLEPRIHTFKIDAQGEETFHRDLNKQFEIRSSYTNYEPSEDMREMRMEQRYIKARNKEASEKREAEEMTGFMNEWSHAKGRIEKELGRRIESANTGVYYKQIRMQDMQGNENDKIELDKIQQKHEKVLRGEIVITQDDLHLSDLSQEQDELLEENGQIEEMHDQSNFIEGDSAMIEEDQQQKRKKKQSQQRVLNRVIDFKDQIPQVSQRNYNKNDTDIHDLELKMAQQKVIQVKKLHGALIGLGQFTTDTERVPEVSSLSIFTQNHKKNFRPFSAAMERCTPDMQRLEQLKEIAEIKSRLAKHKINIPIQTLMTAMMIPDQLSDPSGTHIPDIGYGIMDRGEKQKKKKGKKKKRRN